MDSFLDKVYWGNTVQSYLIVIAGIFITWGIIRIIRQVLISRLELWIAKTSTNYDDVLLSVIQKYISPYIYILINYQIIRSLNLSPRMQKILATAIAMITVYFVIRLINHAVQLALRGFMRRRNESAERIRQIRGVVTVFKALNWIIGFIVLLANLGFDVRTFLAGLGVGGIAIALAAQTILVDLFSYFVIFFDRPFEIGDYVTTPSASGIVEQIGIKTTRLRSLDGEQIIMSNTEMTKSTIRNYKKLERRRSVFTLQLVYSTSIEVLKQIPTITKDAISGFELATFDRTHLSGFGGSSINFEVVYFVESREYVKYMDTQHSVLLKIMEAFRERGIEFAYPTQTLYFNNQQEETKQLSETGDKNVNSGSNDGNH